VVPAAEYLLLFRGQDTSGVGQSLALLVVVPEVLQLCRPAVIGWLDAPSGLFGLRPVQVAPV
jgi:hypothetical protein